MEIKEEYKIKYEELNLTGNLSSHPKYLYEYFLPDDFREVVSLYYGDEEVTEKGCVIYANRHNDYVLACNVTPLVIGYKFEEKKEKWQLGQ